MPEKNPWEPWKKLVDAKREKAYNDQLFESLALTHGYPDHIKEVVAAALTVARLMVEDEKNYLMGSLGLCKRFMCEKCPLGVGSVFGCSVGAYKKQKVKKALAAYQKLYDAYLQAEFG